jgi:hypothetical protein
MNRSNRKADAMRGRLQALTEMDRSACLRLWHEIFATPPAKYLSQTFMQKAIAYELQCRAFGAVPKSTSRVLVAIANGKKTALTPFKTITPGTRLLREWNGRTYEVEVTKDGFLWQAKHYRSLSAIACEITGTRWSGPRFFGVGKS